VLNKQARISKGLELGFMLCGCQTNQARQGFGAGVNMHYVNIG
jgi:hypothetical protein